ncbi:MAG TPA: 2Fe-2S iron-sulfur cluster-binding protein [Burkholderiaceae bacterium]|jgi:ferredoxin
MIHSITLLPNGAVFEAPFDLPILLAAQRAGLRLPSSCRNGTCRTCMCLVVSGTTRYDIEWPGLSVEEKREGYILPCVAYATSDLVIDEPRARQID